MAVFLVRRLEAEPKRIEYVLEKDELDDIWIRFRRKPNLEITDTEDGKVLLSYDGIEYTNRFEKVSGELKDYPNYEHLTLHRNDPSRTVTVLMERSISHPSTLDPRGLVEIDCAHGLEEHPDGHPRRFAGTTWVRSRYVLFPKGPGRAKCIVCWGEVRPDDLTGDA